MKRTILQIAMVFTFFLTGMLTAVAADTFTIDPDHTYVLWHINHFGFSNPSGKWFAKGTLILDKEHPQNDKVNVTINVADMVTGIKELDDHLRGQLFFDTAKYPTATFVSSQVDVTGKNTANVHGMLTVHGVTKPITLNVKFNKAGVSIITNKMTVGFSGHTTLKRSDFGINTLSPGLSDNVPIEIELEAAKNS